MIFTILADVNATLVCNDCITEEQLDAAYSETTLGYCDDCGTRGASLSASQPAAIVIARTMKWAEMWAKAHGLDSVDHKLRLFSTEASSGPTFEGMDVVPELVALLPGADLGTRWPEIEMAMAARSGARWHAPVSVGFTATIHPTIQQYTRMLYGAGPGTLGKMTVTT